MTNFNLANGNTAAGGQSAQVRYETLRSIYEENKGILDEHMLADALLRTAQKDDHQKTQWSIMYNQKTLSAHYWFQNEYDTQYTYFVGM